jgi:hypothetical protein
MLDKMAMKKAAEKLLGSLSELDPSKISSVTISFSPSSGDRLRDEMEEDYGEEEDTGEYPMPEGEKCSHCDASPKTRGKGACCDRCGKGQCPDCGSEMEDNMCEGCEYEDTSMSDLQRMKYKYGAPHMMKMKKLMDKGMSAMMAHKKVGKPMSVRPIPKAKDSSLVMKEEVEDEYED